MFCYHCYLFKIPLSTLALASEGACSWKYMETLSNEHKTSLLHNMHFQNREEASITSSNQQSVTKAGQGWSRALAWVFLRDMIRCSVFSQRDDMLLPFSHSGCDQIMKRWFLGLNTERWCPATSNPHVHWLNNKQTPEQVFSTHYSESSLINHYTAYELMHFVMHWF